MAKRPKQKMVAVPVNLDAAAEFVRRLGEIERERASIESALTEKVEQLKAEATEEAKPLDEESEERLLGLYLFAETNRLALTQDGATKTVKVTTGEFSWRTGPPRIVFKRGTAIEQVVEELRQRGLIQFLRQPPMEPDKEAMLKSSESRALAGSVPTISVEQGEFFTVKPAAEGIEPIERQLKDLRGALAKPRRATA